MKHRTVKTKYEKTVQYTDITLERLIDIIFSVVQPENKTKEQVLREYTEGMCVRVWLDRHEEEGVTQAFGEYVDDNVFEVTYTWVDYWNNAEWRTPSSDQMEDQS